MRKFKCSICGYIYDEAVGIPSKNIPPGSKWENLPHDFVCPLCGAPKSVFKPLDAEAVPSNETKSPPSSAEGITAANGFVDAERILTDGFSAAELSAICSSLAKGCEKQRLLQEMDAFNKIADYFKAKSLNAKSLVDKDGHSFESIAQLLKDDMANGFATAKAAAKTAADRGALRSLTWSEKVSAMAGALLNRFLTEGDAMLENTNIYVCDICGFIYIGDNSPDICPVCKVPAYRINRVERRDSYAGV